jgi:sterol desaturase/sphingolipid hydroxylase (fatty acid hydroxylase superfamily)
VTRSSRNAIPVWLTATIVGGAGLALFLLETRNPLRRRREARLPHTTRNLAMAGLTAASLSLIETPLLLPALNAVEQRRTGLARLPRPLRLAAGILLLDYTLWWWHWMNHRWPILWRFHLVHHVDRDLDASTAIRFHFGEMSLSVLFRMAQIRLFGIDRETLGLWQLLLMVSILFHHSNLRLPEAEERRLARLFVTPRMHGIHHSTRHDETDSNWSSLFSWWDRLHGTFRLDVPQEQLTIGVPAYQEAEEVTLARLVRLPFGEQRQDWEGRSREAPRGASRASDYAACIALMSSSRTRS